MCVACIPTANQLHMTCVNCNPRERCNSAATIVQGICEVYKDERILQMCAIMGLVCVASAPVLSIFIFLQPPFGVPLCVSPHICCL